MTPFQQGQGLRPGPLKSALGGKGLRVSSGLKATPTTVPTRPPPQAWDP